MPVFMSIYFSFKGNCKEAMQIDQTCLGGELELKLYKDAPMEIPSGFELKILHATLTFESGGFVFTHKF